MLTLARSSETITVKELQDRAAQYSWLAQQAHAGFSRLLLSDAQQPTPHLTEREVDILRWTADGKTAADIAQILKISPRTVNFHISNVLTKLGSANKTAAVVQAAVMGLLA